ncbi:MAG: type II secretion system protein [Planctomycetota bacterium]
MRTAFTLIELLVVIVIIAVLAALTMAAVGSADRRAKISATEAMFNVVAGAIGRFEDETGFLPLPTGSPAEPMPSTGSLTSWYPDSDSIAGLSDQRLWWRLATGMDQAATADARSAAEAARNAADPFSTRTEFSAVAASNNYRIRPKTLMGDAQMALAAVTDAVADAYRGSASTDQQWEGTPSYPDLRESGSYFTLSRRGLVKAEILRQEGIMARRRVERAHTTLDLLGPSDVPEALREGDTLLDVWGNPIAYISSSDPGTRARQLLQGEDNISTFISLGRLSRASIKDRNGDGVIDTSDLGVAPPVGEQTDHNADGSIDAYDWGSFLWNALPGYERSYLLISAGPDGAWHRLATDPACADDIQYRGDIEQ